MPTGGRISRRKRQPTKGKKRPLKDANVSASKFADEFTPLLAIEDARPIGDEADSTDLQEDVNLTAVDHGGSSILPGQELNSRQTIRYYGTVNIEGSSSAVLGDVHHHHQHKHYHVKMGGIAHMRSLATLAGGGSPIMERPASPFERLPSYRPEAYTAQSSMPSLYTYFGQEVATTSFARLDQLSMLYSPRAGKNVHLTVSLVTTSDSDFWLLTKLVPPMRSLSRELPTRLLSKIEDCITTVEEVAQGSCYTIVAANNKLQKESVDALIQFGTLSQNRFHLLAELQVLTDSLPHWDCPWFSEDRLDRRPMYEDRKSEQFLTFADSLWVLELRFSPEEEVFRKQKYEMQVLHQLNGLPGLVAFRGVVRDDQGIIVGYLYDLPSQGRFDLLLRRANISVNLRERWCKQIVETVAAFHRNMLVVGMLGEQMDPKIAIDGHDRAVLCQGFRETLAYEPGYLGALPPECRPFKLGTRATPQTDLYQLGRLLWRIAGNRMGGMRAEFCEAAECTTSRDTLCKESHTDPTALPMPEGEYSEHLQRIISSCRAENPKDRLPAHELALMFPDTMYLDDPFGEPSESGNIQHKRPETYQHIYGFAAKCSSCGQDCTSHHFNCNICIYGDYYLCPRCFRRGVHCFDSQHSMREYSQRSIEKEDKFYSSMNIARTRELKTLPEKMVVEFLENNHAQYV